MTRKAVLVVEDDDSILESLVQLLELEKFPVLTARNGQEALAVLQKSAELPGLIFLDLVMPVMDGPNFLFHLQKRNEHSRFKDIPVVVLSSSNALNLHAKVFQILRKPPSVEQLYAFAEYFCAPVPEIGYAANL